MNRNSVHVALVARDTKRCLVGLRSKDGKWGLFGGRIEQHEHWGEALKRELLEEIGPVGDFDIIRVDQYPHPNRIGATARIVIAFVPSEFDPTLNEEHNRSNWVQNMGLCIPPHWTLSFVYHPLNEVSK